MSQSPTLHEHVVSTCPSLVGGAINDDLILPWQACSDSTLPSELGAETSLINPALQAQECLGGLLCRKLHPVPTINEV